MPEWDESSGFLNPFLGCSPYSLSLGNLEPSNSLELGFRRGVEWPTWAETVRVVQSPSMGTVPKTQTTAENGDLRPWGCELPEVSRMKACSTGKVAKPTFSPQTFCFSHNLF